MQIGKRRSPNNRNNSANNGNNNNNNIENNGNKSTKVKRIGSRNFIEDDSDDDSEDNNTIISNNNRFAATARVNRKGRKRKWRDNESSEENESGDNYEPTNEEWNEFKSQQSENRNIAKSFEMDKDSDDNNEAQSSDDEYILQEPSFVFLFVFQFV